MKDGKSKDKRFTFPLSLSVVVFPLLAQRSFFLHEIFIHTYAN